MISTQTKSTQTLNSNSIKYFRRVFTVCTKPDAFSLFWFRFRRCADACNALVSPAMDSLAWQNQKIVNIAEMSHLGAPGDGDFNTQKYGAPNCADHFERMKEEERKREKWSEMVRCAHTRICGTAECRPYRGMDANFCKVEQWMRQRGRVNTMQCKFAIHQRTMPYSQCHCSHSMLVIILAPTSPSAKWRLSFYTCIAPMCHGNRAKVERKKNGGKMTRTKRKKSKWITRY